MVSVYYQSSTEMRCTACPGEEACRRVMYEGFLGCTPYSLCNIYFPTQAIIEWKSKVKAVNLEVRTGEKILCMIMHLSSNFLLTNKISTGTTNFCMIPPARKTSDFVGFVSLIRGDIQPGSALHRHLGLGALQQKPPSVQILNWDRSCLGIKDKSIIEIEIIRC